MAEFSIITPLPDKLEDKQDPALRHETDMSAVSDYEWLWPLIDYSVKIGAVYIYIEIWNKPIWYI